MKKQLRKRVALHKETLRHLAKAELEAAGGLSGNYACTVSCDGTCHLCASKHSNCC
jgi:hypothetical protein